MRIMNSRAALRHAACLGAGLVVAACSGVTVDNSPMTNTQDGPRGAFEGDPGLIAGLGGASIGNLTIGNRARNDALAASVNRHLWLASLDTLSFLPIASTDPFSGVIATDWGGVTDTDLERFRVTAFVTSTTLAPESLRVAVHREVRQGNGPWVAAPVAAETPRQIEDSILTRARQIRLEERGAG